MNDIYLVYKIINYNGSGTEHNYHFSCGMGDKHRGICFLKVKKTMRVHGAVGDSKPCYMDISNFPTSYYNPCQKGRWIVVCVLYDNCKSSLWVNHG